MRNSVNVAAVLMLAGLTGGCFATKGALRKAQAEQSAALAAAQQQQTAALDKERTDRTSADAQMERNIAALRSDLETMRKDFGAKIEAVANGLQFALPVHFAFDQSDVRSEDDAALDRFANIVTKYYGGATVTIEGFADPAGSASYNRRLSLKRANAVKAYLLTKSIQARVRTVGYGEARQVVEGAVKDAPGADQNRRVTFVIESPSSSDRPVAMDR
jgi:peptidoglycan-associated lipoprotein